MDFSDLDEEFARAVVCVLVTVVMDEASWR